MKGRLLTSLLAAVALASLQAQTITSTPKLVVGIAIDQFRTDYMEAFSALYGEKGFKRLLKEGCVYANAGYTFKPVDRSSAVAALYSGTTPYYNGIIANEWLNRIEHNNVDEIFPLFYLEKVGSYHWGLIQGYSQTYEPWGCYLGDIADPDYNGDKDFTKFQHDLYRFNGLPYIAREIEIIKDFSARADKKFAEKQQS